MKCKTRSAWLTMSLLALTGGASAQLSTLTEGLQLSCDNTLTVVDGTDLSLRCAGNLSLLGVLNDVRLDRSGSITLEAGNELSLAGLSLTATSVHMTARGRLQLASDVKIFSPGGVVVLDVSNPGALPPVQLVSGGSVTLRSPADSGGQPGELIVEAGRDVGLGNTPALTTAVPEPSTGLLGLMGAALIWQVGRRRRSMGLGA